MSRASAQVKFKDGTIRYGIYNGTVDVYWPWLFDSSEEAWTAWREYYKQSTLDDSKWSKNSNPKLEGGIEDVEIADDYGSGDTYLGRATKKQITSDCDIDNMVNIKHGLPEWWSRN